MPSPARLRQHLLYLHGLWLRTRASLRSRGLAPTLARIRERLTPPNGAHAVPLHFPDARTAITFPPCPQPLASIIIPVYGQLETTLNCLRALSAHAPGLPFEVIVVDDASPDDSAKTLAQYPGVRLIVRKKNGGFVLACNEGAEAARGQYLVFLNNDTIPQPGWLEALLDTFAQYPDTGLVGAQLVYPDGRLQESGGLVFSDGQAANRGRFGARNHPRYGRLQDADYCSAAAIAIAANLFRQLGGFDRRYAPAYYEDTDLAFAVRAAGFAVRVQPAAVVIHDEGTTAGTDLNHGAKAGQVRNREVFAKKWADTLRGYPSAAHHGSHAQAARARPQVLFIDSDTPRPGRDSASLRLFNLMRLASTEGAEVSFMPDDAAHAGSATQALQRSGIEAWYAPFTTSPSRWLKQEGARFSTIVVSRHHVAQRWIPLIRRYAPQARIVFDSVDLHYLREHRQAEFTQNTAALRAAERTRQREVAIMQSADITWVVSTAEQALLAKEWPEIRVELVSNLHTLADGGLPFAARHGLVFVGGFRHPPNVDAVLWLANDIYPQLRAMLGDIPLDIIGGDVPAEIAALSSHPGIRIHGHIPDITPWMNGARIALAPLRFGAGVKGKVNLSMAHGQPLVATSCAVEGMQLTHAHDVLVADSAKVFADAVAQLYRDEALWNRLSENGRDNIRRHFSADAVRPALRRSLFAS
ncbi:MAG: glycosyltransferase [Pseudomonadota bacterium]|nr:glycosyltransferase [Pseudomonadota bacterium]